MITNREDFTLDTGESIYLNMDCMEGMKLLPDKYIDLAITDPPYGLVEHGGQTGGEKGTMANRTFRRSKIAKWDHSPGAEYFSELFRVSKNQIIWGGNYFNLPPCRCFIVWDKKQPFENFSRCEYAWTSFPGPAKIFEFDNRYAGKIHPTQKPVELYTWLISKFAGDNDIILDTHTGSASSLIACRSLNHRFIAFELDFEYYNKSLARLRGEISQYNIFDLMQNNNCF